MKKFTPEEKVEILQALNVLDKHFQELIVIGASDNNQAATILKFEEGLNIVQHGPKEDKLEGIVMKVLPNAIFNMDPRMKKKTLVIFSGIVKFLTDITGGLKDFHIITEEVKKREN